MQTADFIALAPLLLLAAAIAAVMLQIALKRSHMLTIVLTLAGLSAAMIGVLAVGDMPARQVTPLVTMDRLAFFFIGLILTATAATALLGCRYWEHAVGQCEEYYLLLLVAALGACVLAAAHHFAAFFIGLEILSISLFTLMAFARRRMASVEAGLKYLVLAGVSSAFLLFGIALIYADVGSLAFPVWTARLQEAGETVSPLLLIGMGMTVIGVGFKLALVPFHMWTADIYQGAPAPTTAFVATVSKSAMVALLLRLFAPIDFTAKPALFWTLAILAFASMIVGNILALRQDSVKRILAYSSIAHMGYLLVAFLSGGTAAIAATVFYITAYTITVLGAFGVVTVLSRTDADADSMSDFQGLFFSRPWLAGVFMAMLLSLAGIPLTAGFIGKFYAITAGAQGGVWWLIITLVLTSAGSLFYYLRIVVAMFSPPFENKTQPPATRISYSGGLVLTVMTVLLIWVGSAPGPLIDLIGRITQ